MLEQGLNKLSIHKIIQNTGGAVLSGNVCERDLGTGSGNFFIRKFEG